jgi:hypothetical protein
MSIAIIQAAPPPQIASRGSRWPLLKRILSAFFVTALLGAGLLTAYWFGALNREADGGTATADPIPQVPLANLNPAAEQTGTFIRHDFGIVRPGQSPRHRFTVKNPHSAAWTIRRFHTTCACAVSQASSRQIAPEETAEVEVTYKAPSSNKDDRHRVVVEFMEEGTPFVFLEITARVRESLCCFPERIEVPRVGRGQSVERTFEVHNYTDADFSLASLTSSTSWLTASAHSLGRRHEVNGPRQVWQVGLLVNANGVAPGKHRAELEIRTNAPGSLRKSVPVEIVVSSPIDAIPGQMFLGSVLPGRPTEHRVLLHFTPECLPRDTREITLTHDMGEELVLRCEQRGSEHYNLIAVFSPKPSGDRLVEGTIQVGVQKEGVPVLELSFYARVKGP